MTENKALIDARNSLTEELFDHLKSKRIAIVETRNDYLYLRTCTELFLRLKSAGNEVDMFHLGTALTFCEYEVSRNIRSRFLYRHNTQDAVLVEISRKLGEDGFQVVATDDFPCHAEEKESLFSLVASCSSVEEISNIRCRGVNIGKGIASSLVSQMKDSDPVLQNSLMMLKNLTYTAYEALCFAEYKLDPSLYDVVVVHNGRLSAPAAIAKLADLRGIQAWYSEGPHGSGRYFLDAHTPHDTAAQIERIKSLWRSLEPFGDLRSSLAESYFHSRLHLDGVENSFRLEHQLGDVPEWLKNIQPFVVFFTTSEDEYRFVEGRRSSNWNDQWSAIAVSHDLCESVGLNLVVRVHPNQKYKSCEENLRIKRRISDLIALGITVFDSEHRIDSYELLRESRLVVSVGSTIGAEAIALGVPSVCLGDVAWSHFGGLHPSSRSDFADLISDLDTLKSEPSSIWPFFLHLGHSGNDFNHVRNRSFTGWRIGSTNLRLIRLPWSFVARILNRFTGWRHGFSWF